MLSRLQGIVLFVVVMFAFSIVSIHQEISRGVQNTIQGQVLDNQHSIRANQEMISDNIKTQCDDRNRAATDVNEVLDALIEGTIAWSPSAQNNRLKLWKNAKAAIVECEKVVIK